jgi:hypothetical protein
MRQAKLSDDEKKAIKQAFMECQTCGLMATRLMYYMDRRMCVRCAFDEQVDRERRSIQETIDWCNENAVCIYCGEPSEHREHVVPRHTDLPTYVVSSCAECNLMASGAVFSTIFEKQDYIHSRISKRYSKLAKMPEWDQYELRQIRGRLREYVAACAATSKWVKARLEWDIRALSEQINSRVA